MNRWKGILWVSLAVMAMLAVVASLVPASAVAQVRAALVRDVDSPALQPFRSHIDVNFTFTNEQRLVTTVPAGKRLVIEHVSYSATMPVGTQVVFGGIRSPEFGTFWQILGINPPHTSASPSFVLQDGAQPIRQYFEPNEEVWLSVSTSNSVPGRSIQVIVSGYFVNL
jgi:hypothetical protein